MKDLYYVAQEISKQKNLKGNLLKYATEMASMYTGLAYMKLSMNYYTVYDMRQENATVNPVFEELLATTNGVIDKLLSGQAEDVTEVETVRNRLIETMEVVTQYVDCLRIYEYVLNRVEHRFSGQVADEEYYGMYLTNDLMHYILADKDNVVINSKISEVVGQLPMRLSRNKFFEYLREAFTLYHGAQKGTIDDFAYALRTTAMLQEVKGFETLFPEVYDSYRTLANADYAELTEEEYTRLKNVLTIATEKMLDCADLFVLLTQVVNDLYTIILTEKQTLSDIGEVTVAKQIITGVRQAFDGKTLLSDEVLGKFEYFEGKQERILMILSKSDFAVETALENMPKELEEEGLQDCYAALADVMKLQSGSDFVSLIKDPEKLNVPDNSYADETCENIIAQLKESFTDMPQIVRRAVMSAVLSQLPVFFNNTDEICEYINLSLEQCNDAAEKMAVIEVMKMIMRG